MARTVELVLTTWERMMMIIIIGEVEGPVSVVRAAGKLLDILELQEDDRRLVGMRQVAPGRYQWDTTKEHEWTLQLPVEAMPALRQWVAQYQRWPVVRHQDVYALFEKLAISLPEEGQDGTPN